MGMILFLRKEKVKVKESPTPTTYAKASVFKKGIGDQGMWRGVSCANHLRQGFGV
jgi:hypothetical protein